MTKTEDNQLFIVFDFAGSMTTTRLTLTQAAENEVGEVGTEIGFKKVAALEEFTCDALPLKCSFHVHTFKQEKHSDSHGHSNYTHI